MKRVSVVVTIFFAALHVALAQTTHDTSILVEDLSLQGSPISASGTVSFHVVGSASTTETQCSLNVAATNTSSKPILAYEFSLTALPDYGNGGETFVRQRDYFFVPNSLFMPGSQETEQFTSGPMTVNRRPSTLTPKANVTVLFVEFADGTSFGKSAWGDNLRDSRETTLRQMQAFMRAYDNGRENALSEAITTAADLTYSSNQTTMMMRKIKSMMDTQGPDSALAYIQNALAAAEQYKSAAALGPLMQNRERKPKGPEIKPLPGQILGGVFGGTTTGGTVPVRIRVSDSVAANSLISEVMPETPPIAKIVNVTGTVVLHAIIGKDGSVQELQYVSGPPLLMKSAMDAAKQWRYEPTMLNGQPVEVDTTVDVSFPPSTDK